MVINHVSFIIDDIGTPTMIPINSKIHNFQSANMLCLNVFKCDDPRKLCYWNF